MRVVCVPLQGGVVNRLICAFARERWATRRILSIAVPDSGDGAQATHRVPPSRPHRISSFLLLIVHSLRLQYIQHTSFYLLVSLIFLAGLSARDHGRLHALFRAHRDVLAIFVGHDHYARPTPFSPRIICPDFWSSRLRVSCFGFLVRPKGEAAPTISAGRSTGCCCATV